MWRSGAVALIKLKKRRGGEVAQWFKRWRTSRRRELKKVARAQHCLFYIWWGGGGSIRNGPLSLLNLFFLPHSLLNTTLLSPLNFPTALILLIPPHPIRSPSPYLPYSLISFLTKKIWSPSTLPPAFFYNENVKKKIYLKINCIFSSQLVYILFWRRLNAYKNAAHIYSYKDDFVTETELSSASLNFHTKYFHSRRYHTPREVSGELFCYWERSGVIVRKMWIKCAWFVWILRTEAAFFCPVGAPESGKEDTFVNLCGG